MKITYAYNVLTGLGSGDVLNIGALLGLSVGIYEKEKIHRKNHRTSLILGTPCKGACIMETSDSSIPNYCRTILS